MGERKEYPISPEAQEIALEIANLLKEGCVLSTKDLDEIGTKYQLPSQFIMGNLSRFGRSLGNTGRQFRYQLSDVEVIKIRYKGHLLIRDASFTTEETEWERVTSEIDEKLKEKGARGRLTQKKFL